MRKSGCKYEIFDTNEKYKNNFRYRIGVYDDQFFRLFRNAVAYEPLDKIEDFIVHNICRTEREIDMESMETSIREYKRISASLQRFLSQRNELEKIHDIYEEYADKHRLRTEQRYYINRADMESAYEDVNRLVAKDEKESAECEEKSKQSDRLEESVNKLNDQIYSLKQQIENSPEENHRKVLETKLNELETEIRDIKENAGGIRLSFMQKAAAWRKHMLSVDFGDITELKSFLDDAQAYDNCSFKSFDVERLKIQNNVLANIRDDIILRNGLNDERIKTAEDEKRECASQISQLEMGRKHYDPRLTAFRDYLKKMLLQKTGRDAEVNILADLIDIKDKRWVNVVEGYMNRQKFYLLTEPEYYEIALEICRDYYRQNPDEEYKLIDGEKVYNAKKNIHPRGLSMVIESENIYAKAYVDYLLGHVVRVDSLKELRNYNTAVTDDGMLYSGYTFGRIRENLWKTHFIGKDSVAQQLTETKKRMAELINEIKVLNEKASLYRPIIREKVFSDEAIIQIENAVNDLKRLPALDEECNKIFNEMLSIDGSFTEELRKRRDECKNRLNNIQKEYKDVTDRIAVLKDHHETNIIEIKAAKEQYALKKNSFEAEYSINSQNYSLLQDKYNEILSRKADAKSIYASYNAAIKRTEKEIDQRNEAFIKAVGRFNINYADSSLSDDIHDEEWLSFYDKMKSTNVGDYEFQVSEARRRAEELFENEFINKLKANIDNARMEIRQLNRALSEYRFGKTRYRFKCEPTDNPELRQYYDMITDGGLDGYSLLTADNYKKYETQIKTLFNLISSASSEGVTRAEIQQNIDKYKAFQTYLKFDLVEVNENGEESPLSRVIGSRSGGERQTPFYIAMLASFMKIYRMNAVGVNSLRLVIFDEAFDKIDSSRIEEFVNMLKSTGFQFIISAPNEKAPYIMRLVETTWAVTKPKENVSQVSLFHQELK